MSVHAQSSEDFKGKWVGYIKVDGVPRYRLYLEFSNPQAKQVTGKLNLYDYVKTDQVVKTLTASFDYDKQKRIAYTNTTIPAPSGIQCEGYIILKISASSSDSLEATFRTRKDCMVPQMVISRSNNFLLYDPVFASQKLQPGAVPDREAQGAHAGNSTVKETINTSPRDARTVTQPANAAAPVQPAADVPVIDPQAVYIEGTSFEPFINGTALVQNNRTSGIIDASGKFVLGYGKLWLNNIASMHGALPGNTLYHSATMTTPGYVTADYLYDNRGKLITSFSLPKRDLSVQQDGNSLYANCAYNYHTINGVIVKDFVCINEKGQKFSFTSLYQAPIWSEGLNVIYTEDKLERRSYGYVNPQGQAVIPLKYKDALPFSEGLAAVAIADVTGIYKYGFIDHKGNEVISFIYSNTPGNFHHGLAKVIPKTKDEFELGFINKKGELVLKITKDMLPGQIFDNDDFGDGYIVCTDGLVDINGHVYTRADICRITGLNPSYERSLDMMNFAKGEIFYSTERGKKGLVDMEGKFTIPCIYSELSFFDPVSHLAHARWEKYDVATQKKKVIDGYINQRGEFVIVMGAGSKW